MAGGRLVVAAREEEEHQVKTKFRAGQWVRVTLAESPAYGEEAIVETVNGPEMPWDERVEVTFPSRATIWTFAEEDLEAV